MRRCAAVGWLVSVFMYTVAATVACVSLDGMNTLVVGRTAPKATGSLTVPVGELPSACMRPIRLCCSARLAKFGRIAPDALEGQ